VKNITRNSYRKASGIMIAYDSTIINFLNNERLGERHNLFETNSSVNLTFLLSLLKIFSPASLNEAIYKKS
jgi:GTPase SAR1 family protein